MRMLVAGLLTLAVSNAPVTVRVDVNASDARGRPITDLTPGDFEIREAGQLRTLESVRLVRAEPRLVAVFLDEYHVGAESSARVREALSQFVDGLKPTDQLVVMRPLDSLFAIRLTTDRQAAREAIAAFEGRQGALEPRNAYERNFIAGSPARIEAARTQVALSAINALAVHLGSLGDLRKTLIVVAGDLPRLDRRRGQESLPGLETILRSANRSNVSIYPFDPTVAMPEALRRLADDTDGKPVTAVDGLARAVADASDYYLLAFTTTVPDDGKFHEMQVSVKRKDARVQARKGYWAPSPDDTMRAALLAHINEPKKDVPLEPAPHVSPLIRPWFGISRGPDGKMRVTFVWEPASHVPGERVRHTATRLVMTALAPDGAVLFEGPIVPTGPAAVDEPGTTPARAVFDAPPGRLRLRMTIQDAAAQEIDRDVRELSIRDLRGPVAIGTPEVLRARNAREFRILDGETAVPVAAREFSRTERLLIRFPAYGASDDPPALTARLLGPMGRAIRSLPIVVVPDGEHAIDLPLASLAAGEYTIEVTAKSGGRDFTDRVAFRVTS